MFGIIYRLKYSLGFVNSNEVCKDWKKNCMVLLSIYFFSRCPCNIVLHCFKQHWICWQISNGGIFIPFLSKATKNGMLVTMKKVIFAQYCDNAESSNISYTFLQCMDKTPKREHHPFNLLNPLRRSMVFYLILLQVAGTVHQRSLNFTCWLITS